MPEYEGKINCIYIDPPYNTGKEGWVYNDAVNDPRVLKWLGQVVGKEGEDLSRHDKWLCMMYPRLKLLHRLLASDGVIFISIDNNEQAALKILCDEIFGYANHITNICCVNNPKGRSDERYFATAHEYILAYKKTNALDLAGFVPDDVVTSRYNKVDNGRLYREIDLRKTGDNDTREDREKMYYPFFYNPQTQHLIVGELDEAAPLDYITIYPKKTPRIDGRWRWSLDLAKDEIHTLFARYMPTKKQWSVFEKDYLDTREHVKPTTVWNFKDVNSERGTELFIKYLGFNKDDFPNPKPIGTIKRLIGLVKSKNAIILDSFAGSGTTAQAVLALNTEDGGNRQFICIEMMDYAETVTAERVRRVISGYGEGKNSVAGTGGKFDYYTLGATLFNDDKNLNEDVGETTIRNYVAYSEHIPLSSQSSSTAQQISPYVLGITDTTLWVFYYNRDRITTLNIEFLGTLNINALQNEGKKRPNLFVIYADKCALSKDFLYEHGIRFKRIPRDITRF